MAPSKYDIVWVKFLWPLPLLLTGDQGGYIFVWDLKSKDDQYKCVMYTRNMFNLKEAHTTTACDYIYVSSPSPSVLPSPSLL